MLIFITVLYCLVNKSNCPDKCELLYRGNERRIAAVKAVTNGVFQYVNENGYTRVLDFENAYVKIIDGLRVVDGAPSDAERIIWFMGHSVSNGLFLSTEDTLCSCFQKLLNTTHPGKFCVKCLVCKAGDDMDVTDFIAEQDIQPNDIVVVVRNFSLFFNNQPYLTDYIKTNFRLVNSNPWFQRSHNFGEVFVDSAHVNHVGSDIYANGLYEDIKDLLDDKNVIERKVQNPVTNMSVIVNKELSDFVLYLQTHRQQIGAIVMNCNPFTIGHRYLIEYASKKVSHLYIFVVEENKSVFPFNERIELVKQGIADLRNITVLPSGKFIISRYTFPMYFEKATMQDVQVDPSQDVTIFAKHIAPALGINVRFAGEEPLDRVTLQYNQTMERILPKYGIEFVVIPRKESGGTVISASRVRALLKENNLEEIKKIVPETTLSYLMLKYGNRRGDNTIPR